MFHLLEAESWYHEAFWTWLAYMGEMHPGHSLKGGHLRRHDRPFGRGCLSFSAKFTAPSAQRQVTINYLGSVKWPVSSRREASVVAVRRQAWHLWYLYPEHHHHHRSINRPPVQPHQWRFHIMHLWPPTGYPSTAQLIQNKIHHIRFGHF